jgi:hypothetical protein
MDEEAHLDIVPVWLPLDRYLCFKAKYVNEHLSMNLDFNWMQACNVQALFIVSGNDRPHPNLLPRGEGTAMACVSFAVARRANPVAGAFWFRGSRRELVGGNLSPFCYRKTRRGRHAPRVFLNHATCHSWPQTRTVPRYALNKEDFPRLRFRGDLFSSGDAESFTLCHGSILRSHPAHAGSQ